MPFPTFPTHTDGTNETITAAHMNNVQTAATTLNNFPLSVSAESTLINSEVLLRFVCPVAMSIAANLAGSVGSAMVAPTATATINIVKRVSGATGTSVVGSFNFTTGALPRAANLSTQAVINFAAGDELTIVGPASADATLASWSFTLLMYLP